MNNISSLRAALMCMVLGTLLSACVTTREELGKKDDVAAASANMQLAISAMQTNDLELSKSKIDKALSQDPHSASVRYVAGLLYARIKEYGKADSFYSQAIDLEPHNGDYINGYAAYLCKRKSYSKGEKMALRAADDPLYKTPYIALLNAGNCALDEGRLNVAEDYFRRALKLQPNFSAALLQMAELEVKSANYLSARAFLERYQQYGPVVPASLLLGVRIERGMGNMGAAQNYARRLKEEYPTADETKALLDLERK